MHYPHCFYFNISQTAVSGGESTVKLLLLRLGCLCAHADLTFQPPLPLLLPHQLMLGESRREPVAASKHQQKQNRLRKKAAQRRATGARPHVHVAQHRGARLKIKAVCEICMTIRPALISAGAPGCHREGL